MVVRSVLALPASMSDTGDVQRAGVELDADFVLTGTLLRSGSRVRVSAQLVEVGTGHATWAQQTDGFLDDLFELQDSMACTIMTSLPFPKAKTRDSAEIPQSEVAYRLLPPGQSARPSATHLDSGPIAIPESLAADDRFAPSWAGLGRLERVLAKYLVEGTDQEGYAAAENSLRRALELSPELAQAHYHYAQLEADTTRTEEALSRLLRRLHVRRTEPEIYAGLVLVCRYCGLFPASVAAHHSAVALDPTIKTSIGLTMLARSEFDEALRIATDDNEDELRIIVLAAMNRQAEALELARQPSPRLWGRDSTAEMRTLLRAFLEDRTDDAIAALHVASGVDPQNPDVWPRFPDGEDAFWMARLYARLGLPRLGLLGFRAAIELGYFAVSQFEADSWLDPIESDPAFADTLTLARTRHQRAIRIFNDEGGPGLLGVDAPSP